MPSLKDISIALGLLTSDHPAAVDVDGWQGYVWRVLEINHCLSITKQSCKILEDRWDWKRPQFYDFSVELDPRNNQILSRIGLRNEDKSDIDNVCIVAAFLDGDGNEIGILFVNWPSRPGRPYARAMPIRPAVPVTGLNQVVVGTKQCSQQATADAKNYQRLRQKLKQR